VLIFSMGEGSGKNFQSFCKVFAAV